MALPPELIVSAVVVVAGAAKRCGVKAQASAATSAETENALAFMVDQSVPALFLAAHSRF
jgi:hypothetical protein